MSGMIWMAGIMLHIMSSPRYPHSYVGLYARALANMYRLGYNWRKRMNCIRSVKNNKSNILLFDENNSYKTTYLVARTFPSFMVDIILGAVGKW